MDDGGDFQIPEQDRERIEAEVSAYRRKLEWLYQMAYIQAQIDAPEVRR